MGMESWKVSKERGSRVIIMHNAGSNQDLFTGVSKL